MYRAVLWARKRRRKVLIANRLEQSEKKLWEREEKVKQNPLLAGGFVRTFSEQADDCAAVNSRAVRVRSHYTSTNYHHAFRYTDGRMRDRKDQVLAP